MRESVVTAPAPLPGHPELDRHHTCTSCPVCGSEDCSVLQDLGMSCDTAQAAQEARAARRGGRKPVSRAGGAAGR